MTSVLTGIEKVTTEAGYDIIITHSSESFKKEAANAMNHICLEVDSMAATAEALRALGVPLFREPKLGLDGNNQCWIKDPDGNRIEFMEMRPGNMQDAAIARIKANAP